MRFLSVALAAALAVPAVLANLGPAKAGLFTPDASAFTPVNTQSAGGSERCLWGGTTGEKTMNGYRAEVSTQVPSASMVFGDWSQIIIGEWMALEVAINPYANFAAGITGVRGWATVDVGVRQAGAFSIATSIS